ncbi:MAG: hypothetical protein RBS80_23805 [Thermoguttaceae bacterium]|jgi:hypothetical protein|nr:hypothetical protein [Thermoguttaceae bacterium]
MRTTGFTNRFAFWLGLAILALPTVGCTTLTMPSAPSLPDSLPGWPAGNATRNAPRTLAVVWTPAVLQAPGATPTRGFGGLVTFYGNDRNTPMKVEGQLTVYAYKDSPGKSEKIAPDVKYVFPAEQLATHYGKSALGHSYSIWVPWDQAGGPRQDITLTACFEPAEGELVMGTPTRVVLEGPSKAQGQASGTVTGAGLANDADSRPRPAGITPPSSPSGAVPTVKNPSQEMTTTTLSLPRGVQR